MGRESNIVNDVVNRFDRYRAPALLTPVPSTKPVYRIEKFQTGKIYNSKTRKIEIVEPYLIFKRNKAPGDVLYEFRPTKLTLRSMGISDCFYWRYNHNSRRIDLSTAALTKIFDLHWRLLSHTDLAAPHDAEKLNEEIYDELYDVCDYITQSTDQQYQSLQRTMSVGT